MQIILIGAAAGLTAQGINTSYVRAAAPTHIPRNIQVNENHSLYKLAAAVAGNCKEDVCCGCSSGSRSKACIGKHVGKCVWALLQQTGIVLGQLCQPAAH